MTGGFVTNIPSRNDINPTRCPLIHPIEGRRCEKLRGHMDEHIVKCYWSGGDSLRWPH